MGHWVWGMGHGAWGMGHGAWGMGHGAWRKIMFYLFPHLLSTQHCCFPAIQDSGVGCIETCI
ncbi:MAG: hypothetical protein V7K34_31735 [Nostoc sp.]